MKHLYLLSLDLPHYTVRFIEGHTLDKAILWCEDYESEGHYTVGGHCLYFEKEDDAIMCSLRWT